MDTQTVPGKIKSSLIPKESKEGELNMSIRRRRGRGLLFPSRYRCHERCHPISHKHKGVRVRTGETVH